MNIKNGKMEKKENCSRVFNPTLLWVIFVESIIFLLFMQFLLIKNIFDYKVIFFLIFIITFFLLKYKYKSQFSLILESFEKHSSFSNSYAVLLIAIVPFILKHNSYLIHVFIICGLNIMVALGLNMQLGSLGLSNFAFAAFYGVGAYTAALLTTKLQINFWLAIIGAIIAAGIFGAFICLLTSRSAGFYYALLTIAFQQIFQMLLMNLKFTGGLSGIMNIPFPRIGSFSFGSPIKISHLILPHNVNIFYLVLFLTIAVIYIANNIYNSRNGLVWNAIKEDAIAARCVGINIILGKISASVIGAAFAGVAGSIYAHYISYISPESFAFALSVIIVSIVVLGGLDSVPGIILGAVILTFTPEKIRGLSEYRLLFYGLIIVGVLAFQTQGLIPKKIRKY